MASETDSSRHLLFRGLHESGCFILPNPWDPGSARWLEHLGFKALATTSAGFAFSHGCPDRKVPLALVLQHCRELVQATRLPINVDFEDGYAKTLSELETNVAACVETGISALSIEDAKPAPHGALYELAEAVERIRVARETIDAVAADVMLVGRAECYLVGQPDLKETIRRLTAYADAGADCLYAPGLSTREDIAAVVRAVSPKPVNVMMGPAAALGFGVLAEIGVRRISTASTLALAAWTGFARAAEKLLRQDIAGFDVAVTYPQLGQVFGGTNDTT